MKNSKFIFLLIVQLLLLLSNTVKAQDNNKHPCIWVNESDKESVLKKIKTETWAQESYSNMRNSIEKYVNMHIKDSNWIVSRLAMYWKNGEHFTQCYLKNQNWDKGTGNAPVPTVRMPGMRTWNKYVNVCLENRIPFNESGDMLGINRMAPNEPPVTVPYKESGHMVRQNNIEILTMAEKAAFIYWISGEEKFAKFSADIFNTWLIGTYYMNPILDPEKSTESYGGWASGGICGFYDYEQIHDDLGLHAAIIYDFIYNYLQSHISQQIKATGMTLDNVAGIVFKKFIDIGMIRGSKYGNWNVNGWNMMLYPILVLKEDRAYKDGHGKEYYLQYLINKSTDYHSSITDFIKGYDKITGLWPEAPGYAFGTIGMLLNWTIPLKNAGYDIIENNCIIKKAALAVFPCVDESSNMIVFGDSRGGHADYRTFENLLTYYTLTHNEVGIDNVSAVLNKGIKMNKYSRNDTGWEGLCSYSKIKDIDATDSSERTSYSKYHEVITMKNWLGENKMMAIVYGGHKGAHLSPNGLALQFYAFGHALVPDAAAYESYWTKDYFYHQSATGTNTILPGYTSGDIHINALEPSVSDTDFVNRKELTPIINFTDVTANEKRRTVAMIRVSNNYGYYIDIFRSNLSDNDYIFHNIGKSMSLKADKRRVLSILPEGPLDTTYHIGYSYFSNIKGCYYHQNFIAEWNIDSITSRLWMAGANHRHLFMCDAPSTTLNKDLTIDSASLSPSPTPTLIVRQESLNAKFHPFMAAYEAFKNDSSIINNIKAIPAKSDNTGMIISLNDGITDYVLSGNHQTVSLSNIYFNGCFGFVRKNGKQIELVYLGNGKNIKASDVEIIADTDSYAAVYKEGSDWYYSANQPVTITIRRHSFKLKSGYKIKINN